jgi:hypothetical protein
MSEMDYRLSQTKWVITPDNLTLCDPSNWQVVSKNRYRAMRSYIVILEYRDYNEKSGPPFDSVPLMKSGKLVFGGREVEVVTNTTTYSDTIQETFSNKISAEVTSKLAANPTSGLLPEIQSKISSEFTTSLSSQLSVTKSYQVQSTREFMSSISVEYPEDGQIERKITCYFYLPLWPVYWDIYLYKVESIELFYGRFWSIRKYRDMNAPLYDYPKTPLSRISFYEPQKTPFSSLVRT